MRRLLPFTLPLLAAACTVGPDYHRPAVPGEAGAWTSPGDSAAVDQEAELHLAANKPSLVLLFDLN